MRGRLEPRWAIFISGRGSNLQAILDTLDESRVSLVISNSPKAPGILKARRQGVPVLTTTKKIDWNFIDEELRRRKVQKIFLAGFMKLLPPSFVEKWENRLFNVHPSLLPEFPGLHAIEKSFEARADMGVTVHHVIAEMDAGEVVLQKKAVDKKSLVENKVSLEVAQIAISKVEQFLVREAVRRG